MEERYPGYIMRQSLVDFVRDFKSQMAVQSEETNEKLIKKAQKGSGNEGEYEALERKYYTEIGMIKALRDIEQWAVIHQAPPGGNVRC